MWQDRRKYFWPNQAFVTLWVGLSGHGLHGSRFPIVRPAPLNMAGIPMTDTELLNIKCYFSSIEPKDLFNFVTSLSLLLVYGFCNKVISERWNSDQLYTFTSYLSSLLGVIALQNPYFSWLWKYFAHQLILNFKYLLLLFFKFLSFFLQFRS